MAFLDIFRNRAFSTTSLTAAINIVPNMYGKLNELNLFPGEGVTTTTITVEYDNHVLNLLPTLPRGAPPTTGVRGRRSMRSFQIPHIPYSDVVRPDEVQDVRAFGSENQLEAVADVVNKKLEAARRKHAITLEFLRMGALKGEIIDATGATLFDIYDAFGVSQKVVNFNFAGAGHSVEASAREISRHIEDNLLGEVMTNVYALCSPEFFDALTKDEEVRDSYRYFQSMADPLRRDPRKGFTHQGITFEEHRGSADFLAADDSVVSRRFIPEGEAIFFPLGTQATFKTWFAPANTVEAVNTIGQELYAALAPEPQFGRWIDIYTESNPLPLVTRPALVVRGTVG